MLCGRRTRNGGRRTTREWESAASGGSVDVDVVAKRDAVESVKLGGRGLAGGCGRGQPTDDVCREVG